jgi:amino acid adenylation domain-containing protein
MDPGVTRGQEIGQGMFPLSPQQERMWELERRPGADLPPRAACLVDVRGRLDAERLVSALRDVVDRHEILRTRFSISPIFARPQQEVLATGLAAVTIESVDLGGDTGPALDGIYERLSRATTDGARPSALAALVTVAEHHHALVLSLPALALDHQALDDLVAAVAAAYGRSDVIADPCQYGDVAAWQHEILDSPESRGEREAWTALAKQAREVALPFAPARSAAARRGLERADIAGPEREKLTRAASGSEAVLLTAWGLVLARLAGLEAIAVAVGSDGRTYEELRGTLGPFAKHLPVSLPVRPGQSFAAATREVAALMDDARSRQEYFHPNEPALASRGEDARATVSFVLHPRPASWTADGVSFSLARRGAATDEGRIALVVHEQADRFALELRFDEALHGRDDMARLLASYRALVGQALAEPDRPVDELARDRTLRTPTQVLLAGLWAQLLGTEVGGARDNFFELGGHSLLAMPLVARVQELFAVELPLRVLFQHPVLEEMAEEIDRTRRSFMDGELLRRVPRDGALPLSYGQQRLWFLEQLHPGSGQYNMLLALQLRGHLDQAAFRASVQALVDRHEALRTSFLEVSGQARQKIEARVEAPIETIDLSAVPADARRAAVDRHVRLELRRKFDLSSAPLLHATLLELGPGENVLLIAQHHIISDGWSSLVVVREFASLYDAALRGERCSLPELAVQYVDFAAWQRQWWEAESSRQLAYWRQRLRGAPAALDLPTDRARPEVQSFAGGRCARDLARGFNRELRAFAHREGVTSFMVVLAAFQVLLSRYSGQKDILVGTPFANRRFCEVENVLGLFLNVVVLRTDLSGNPSFRELLARVRTAAVEAYEHQEVPFEELVRELAPDRDLTRHPLFQVMLVANEEHASDLDRVLRCAGLEVERIAVDEGPAKFELNLVMAERAGELSVLAEYASDLFDRATVLRMLEQLEVLVSAAMRNPETRIQSLPILTGEEERALARWNGTGADHGLDRCVHELIADQARRTPHAVAVSFEDDQLTFIELDRRANHLAHRLRELGVGPDAVVGVCMHRSLELIVALLGILKAGGAYMPLDPDHPTDRLAFMLSEVRPPIVLTSAALRGRVPATSAHVLILDRSSWARGHGQADVGAAAVTSPDQLAYLLFTSGSTGKPKGVMCAHRGVVNRLLWGQEAFRLGPGDVLLHKTPLTFDISVWELFWPLMTGARLALAVPGGHKDPDYIQAAIAERGVTVVHFVPSLLSAFLSELDPGRCASLRLLVSSGEALPPAVEERSLAILPWAALHNLYGPTEASIEVTAWACGSSRPSTTVPIGRPISNTQVHLVGAGLERVPLGGRGELCIGGVPLARGYLGRPGLTAERFVPDPISAAGGRLYRTGDLARHLPDGSIEFLGRMDDQVKVRGQRIELGEVEAALRRHPAVRDAVVVARDDRPGGVTQLVAYLVSGPPGLPAIEELRASLRASLPEGMIPSAYVVMDALPLTSSGKVDRRALPPAAIARDTMKPGREHVAPRDDIERALTHAWSRALRVDQVGIDDDYFALGGDSVTVLQVRALARADGVLFSVQDLFRHPTVRRLAASLRLRAPSTSSAAAFAPVPGPEAASISAGCSAEVEDSYPASGMQELMVRRYEEDTAHVGIYHLQHTFHLAADHLSPDALRSAFERIVARHPALRTGFGDEPSGRGLRQIVRRRVEWTLEEEDISHLPHDLQEERVEAVLVSDRQTPFAARSAEAPMFRVRWLGRSPRSGELVLSFHHAITDGWSNVQLLRELFELYVAGLRGRLPPAPSPTSNSVKEFIALEQVSLRSSQAGEFWRDAVRARPSGSLPLQIGGPRRSTGQIRTSLPPATVERVSAIARELRVSKKAILLGAYVDVLREQLDGESPAVGVVCSGRSERLSDPLGALGLFWNLVPFFAPGPAAPPARWVAVHRRLLEIEAHASYPLPAIQAAAGADELFAATFNFTSFPELVPPAAPDVSVPRLLGLRSRGIFHYPLGLVASAPPEGDLIDLHFEFDPDQLGHADVARMSARYISILGGD